MPESGWQVRPACSWASLSSCCPPLRPPGGWPGLLSVGPPRRSVLLPQACGPGKQAPRRGADLAFVQAPRKAASLPPGSGLGPSCLQGARSAGNASPPSVASPGARPHPARLSARSSLGSRSARHSTFLDTSRSFTGGHAQKNVRATSKLQITQESKRLWRTVATARTSREEPAEREGRR